MGCKQVKSKDADPNKKPPESQDKANIVDNDPNKPGIQPPQEGLDKKEEGKDNQQDKEINKNQDIVLEGVNQGQGVEINYKVNVRKDNLLIWEKIFPGSTIINSIIELFQKEHQGEPLNAEAKILIDGKVDFDPQKKLQDFAEYANEEKEIQVDVVEFVKSKKNDANIPLDAFDLLKEGQDMFVKPHLNPFCLIIFNNSKKGLMIKSFSNSSIEQYGLNAFSNTSAYCNGNKCLFLSGGEQNNQVEGNFWIIELPAMNILFQRQCMMPRKSHSMIYIPNSYVFMVGGSSKDVVCFDTSQKQFLNWGSLNKDRIEPSLAFMNNKYLYAISYTKNDLSFERCNLRKEMTWKVIMPQLANNLRFTQKFFGIIHESKDVVLFFGGCQMNDDQDSKCFEFHQKKKELVPSEVPFKEIDFLEKTFSFMNQRTACLIPNCSLNDMNIILFNLEKMESEIVHFQQDRKPDQSEKNKQKSVIQSLKLENLQLNLNMPNDSALNQNLNQNLKG